MTTTTLHPEATAFLAEVRSRLADLTDDQRDELLEGLEADLSEQLAAGDPLPEPSAYAAELRAAAGLPVARRAWRWPAGAGDPLDRVRAGWLRLVGAHDLLGQGWSLVQALRPAWWVLRAWVAVTLLDQLSGPWEPVSLVPSLVVPLLGPLVLAAAIVISALIGLGRLWPGSGPERPVLARVVLLALNVVAVVAPLSFNHGPVFVESYYPSAVARPVPDDVLRNGPHVVRNIYAYDASGQPLTGVQLFDQAGRPVAVSPRSSLGGGARRQVTCPWFNGTTALFNVFPLAQRTQRRGTCLADRAPVGTPTATQQPPPLASVPPVSAGETTIAEVPAETP